ncbi:MAG TPA: hypothetical protein DDW53_12910 [Lachnoclostridium sp.]|nr:hypothetical protein [Lachnoclostridium sp.]
MDNARSFDRFHFCHLYKYIQKILACEGENQFVIFLFHCLSENWWITILVSSLFLTPIPEEVPENGKV